MQKYPQHYPEEYISGEVTFFGRKYAINPHVLIPRLETESLVRRARDFLQKTPGSTVIDLGSGSGIIGTSVAEYAGHTIFVDISHDALDVARRNFLQYYPDQDTEFIVSDLVANLDFGKYQKSQILIVANLPYVRRNDWDNMSADTRYEPTIALFGGERTGFELYERLFLELDRIAINMTLMIEFGYDQREIAEDILKKYPHWRYTFFADYAGIIRFLDVEMIDSVILEAVQ